MWSAPQGLAQVPQPHANPTAPAQSIGLFGAVPCPYCGQPTTVGSGGAGAAAGYAGGLVGALLVHAFAGKHYCSTHGQVPSTAFPPQHRTMILARKVALVGTAVLVLLAVTVLLAVLRS